MSNIYSHFILADIGYAYLLLDDLEKAQSYLGRALKNNPEYSQTYYYWSQFFQKTGRLDMALICLEKAIELYPKDVRYKEYQKNLLEKMENQEEQTF